VVWSNKRVRALQIDVITEGDQRSLGIVEVDAAGGVSEDDRLHSHARENAHRERDLFGGVAFVKMNAALHAGDRDAVDVAEYQLASVADGSGTGKVRDFRVRNSGSLGEFVGESAEAGAKHERD